MASRIMAFSSRMVVFDGRARKLKGADTPTDGEIICRLTSRGGASSRSGTWTSAISTMPLSRVKNQGEAEIEIEIERDLAKGRETKKSGTVGGQMKCAQSRDIGQP